MHWAHLNWFVRICNQPIDITVLVDGNEMLFPIAYKFGTEKTFDRAFMLKLEMPRQLKKDGNAIVFGGTSDVDLIYNHEDNISLSVDT